MVNASEMIKQFEAQDKRIAELYADLAAMTAERDYWKNDFNALNEGGLKRVAEIITERDEMKQHCLGMGKATEFLTHTIDRLTAERDKLKRIAYPICPHCGLENVRIIINHICDRCGGVLRDENGGSE